MLQHIREEKIATENAARQFKQAALGQTHSTDKDYKSYLVR